MQKEVRYPESSREPSEESPAPGEDPSVTVVVVPRERFSLTRRSLEDLYEHTTVPFRLIYVDGGAPSDIRRYLEEASNRRHFQLIRVDRFLSPNEARNLAQREVKTKYVVFLDNDILFTAGWLEKLIRCAEETGAWVVGPLYLEGELGRQTIHMAGGFAHITEEGGRRVFHDEHLLAGASLAEHGPSLSRKPCDYVEFHCALVRNEVFERLGPLDEGLLSLHEHIDFGLRVQRAGGSVYTEPHAVVSYVPPPPYDSRDFPYFMMRWSDAWNRTTVRRFKEKWDYSVLRFYGDPTSLDGEDTVLRWARGHRRLMTGLRISEELDGRPRSRREEAQLMVALFLSVDREGFDLVVAADDESPIEESIDLDSHGVLDRLTGMLARCDQDDLNLMIRPHPWPATHPVVLLRLDDLDERRLAAVRAHAFLVLETLPGTYQCWLAVAKGDPRSAALWRRLGVTGPAGEAEPVRIAGSKVVNAETRLARGAGDFPRIRLVDGRAGLLNPLRNLEDEGLLPLLRCGVVA
jgi:GT2 family glycosyltransferase